MRYFFPMFLALLLTGCISSNTSSLAPVSKTPTSIPDPAISTANIQIETPIPTAIPALTVVNGCMVNPLQVDFFTTGKTPFLTSTSLDQGERCWFATDSGPFMDFSLLFSPDWEISLMGSTEFTALRYNYLLGFRPQASAEPEIFVLAQLADFPLENADSGIGISDTLKEKSIQRIGDKQVFVTVSINGDQTIKRYFIRYDSHDKEPRARLFAFEATITTAQFDQPELQERLRKIEEMIASFKYLFP